jgi:hypothetical protein
MFKVSSKRKETSQHLKILQKSPKVKKTQLYDRGTQIQK